MEEKINYFLISCQIIYKTSTGLERQRNVMTFLASQHRFVTRRNITYAQAQAIERFEKRLSTSPDNEIIDVVITSISSLGQMTQAQFDAGMPIEAPTEDE